MSTETLPRVALCTPHGAGGFGPGYLRSFVRTYAVLKSEFTIVQADFGPSSLVALNRNSLVAIALHAGADVVLQVDADQVWSPDDVRAVVEPIVAGHARFVGAPIAGRVVDWQRVHAACARGVPPEELHRHGARVNVQLRSEDIETKRPRWFRFRERFFVRCYTVGLGLTAISASALREMAALVPAYPEPLAPGGIAWDLHPQGASAAHYCGEDSGLCMVAERAGIERWVCAQGTDVGHELGSNRFHQAWLAELIADDYRFDEDGAVALTGAAP